MTRYLLSVYQPEGAPPPEELDTIMREVDDLTKEMKQAGVWVFDAGLEPPESATVIRVRGDKVLTTDGPFAESKEFIGGFTVIEAPNLDTALEWGARLARVATLAVEVRPFWSGHQAFQKS